MPHRFRGVYRDGGLCLAYQRHDGRHHVRVVDAETLRVRVQFPKSNRASVQAAARFDYCRVSPRRIHRCERGYPVGVAFRCAHQVVVRGPRDFFVGPSEAHDHRVVDLRFVHVSEQRVHVGDSSTGVGEQCGIGGILRRQFPVASPEGGRQDVAVKINDQLNVGS